MPSLDKLPYSTCKHACATGCASYTARPGECHDYRCLWLDDAVGDDDDRPDRLGLMFDLPSLIEDHPDYQGVQAICARELHPRARDDARAAAMLTRLARVMVVRLTSPAGRTELMGPRHLVDLLVERARVRLMSSA